MTAARGGKAFAVSALTICAVVLAGISGRSTQTRTAIYTEENIQEQEIAALQAEGESETQKAGTLRGESKFEAQETGTLQAEGESGMQETAALQAEGESGMQETGVVQSESESGTQEEKKVVAIDPGHQGSNIDMSDTEPIGPGASEMKAKASTGTQGRFSGVPEYELNLEISLLLRDELEERGYEVIMTREDNDTAISNAQRATLAYEQGGDIFLRIHANGLDDSSVSGALAMVPSPQNPYVGDLAEESYALADCILSAYCDKAGFGSLGIQYYDDMTGINWSKLPVMILEMGFMTNESDDWRMEDASVQALMAEGIADGIDAYFQQAETDEG